MEFHLLVEASEKFNRAVGATADFISRAVEARVGTFCCGIDNESFGRQLGTIEITASEACAANPQFAGLAFGNGLATFIENMELGVRNRRAERDLVG